MPSSVVPKWCDGVWERFRGVRGVFVGLRRVSEDVLQCFWYLWCLVLFRGDWRGLVDYLGDNEIRSELLRGFWGFF